MDIAERFFGRQVSVWGRNATVGTGIEDLTQYDQATDWYAILTATGATLDVSSSSANDTVAGSAAQKVRICGLGADFKPLTVDLSLAGQTIAPTTGYLFTDVFGAAVIQHGATTQGNVGDLHMVKTGTGGSYTGGVPGTLTSALLKMLALWGRTEAGHWAVPLGYPTYQLKGLVLSAYTQAAVILVCSKSPWGTNKATLVEIPVGVGAQASGWLDLDRYKIQVKEKEAILLRPLGAAASAVVQAGMVLEAV